MRHNVAILETDATEIVAILENDGNCWVGYTSVMLSDWLRKALQASNTKQAELARILSERLGRSIDRAAVNKMVKGSRAIQGDELLEIEKITGYDAPRGEIRGKAAIEAVLNRIDGLTPQDRTVLLDTITKDIHFNKTSPEHIEPDAQSESATPRHESRPSPPR